MPSSAPALYNMDRKNNGNNKFNSSESIYVLLVLWLPLSFTLISSSPYYAKWPSSLLHIITSPFFLISKFSHQNKKKKKLSRYSLHHLKTASI